MNLQRAPSPALRPYLKFLWASDETDLPPGQHDRERMLPTGNMHIVLRLSEDPIRIFNSVEDSAGKRFPCGVVAGLRSRYYVKDVSKSVRTVGAVFQPGACRSLIGASAEDLAEHHTSLEEIWGASSMELREQLQAAKTLMNQTDVLEKFLAARLSAHPIHPAVAFALERFSLDGSIGSIVKECGYSHKHFIHLFREEIGLRPGLYCRVLRFQKALLLLPCDSGRLEPPFSWIEIALQAGYSDQAHFNRDFREFTGISPSQYQNLRSETNHVMLP